MKKGLAAGTMKEEKTLESERKLAVWSLTFVGSPNWKEYMILEHSKCFLVGHSRQLVVTKSVY